MHTQQGAHALISTASMYVRCFPIILEHEWMRLLMICCMYVYHNNVSCYVHNNVCTYVCTYVCIHVCMLQYAAYTRRDKHGRFPIHYLYNHSDIQDLVDLLGDRYE